MVIDIVDVRKQISISDFSLITKNDLNNRVSENSGCIFKLTHNTINLIPSLKVITPFEGSVKN